MRDIKKIILHCSQTPNSASVGAMIRDWTEVRGWNHMGYHYIILPTGHVINLEPIESVAYGAKGHNKDGLHIAYVGGAEDYNYNTWVDNRTDEQKASMIKLVEEARAVYPNAKIVGHCELNKDKECPAFDVKKEFKYLNNKE